MATLLAVIAVFFVISLERTEPALAQTVVLDAGHGGVDPGAVGCQREEAPSVLDVVLRTQAILTSSGAQVELTRVDDRRVELRARAEFANQLQASVFVSVHANANSGTPATGTETWIAEAAGGRTASLASLLQGELINAWGLRDRGVKRNNFTVLTATAMPAALTEIGFINRCDQDSALIGDPDARQEIALAHARGVAEFLALPPPDGGVMPTPTGTLLGVVFEDLGEGLEDTSRRLSGVEVLISPLGERLVSAAETGAWSITVEPGDYTVEGRLDGYLMGRRACSVTAGEQRWCSFGLRRDDQASLEDMGMTPSDMSSVDLGVDLNVTDGSLAGELGGELAGSEGGETSGDFAGDLGGERMNIAGAQSYDMLAAPPRVRADEGCHVLRGSSRSELPSRSLGVLLLLMIAAWRRVTLKRVKRVKRRACHTAFLTLTCLSAPFSGLSSVEAHVPDVSMNGDVSVSAHASQHGRSPLLNVSTLRRVASGDYLKALLSPSGDHLLLVDRDGATLSLLDVRQVTSHLPKDQEPKHQRPKHLITLRGAGRNPSWTTDGAHIALHTPDQSPHALPLIYLTLSGDQVGPQRASHNHESVKVSIKRGEVKINDLLIDPEVDRFFYARVSPDRAHVALWGLYTGLWLYRLWDHALIPLGSGGHPSFGPNGHTLFFERTSEERGAIRGADLFYIDLASPLDEPTPLTKSADRLEFSPSVGGQWLTFVDGRGDVWLGALRGVSVK